MPETLATARVGPSLLRWIRYHPQEALPVHAHERATISLLLTGDLLEDAQGAREEASALSVVFKPAGVPHGDQVGGRGATVLQIELGQDDEEVLRAAAPMLGAWHWSHATPSATHLVALAGTASEGGPRIAEATLRRRLLRVVHGLRREDRGRPRTPANPHPWLAEARARLASAARPVAIRDLAAHAAVHPVHLAREFRRCYGESPAGFRGRHRLRRAAQLLTGTRERLADVAYLAGFADQAHMTRDLVRRVGVTPGALRHLAETIAAT